MHCSAQAALLDLSGFFLSPSCWWRESDPGLRAFWPLSWADDLVSSPSEPPKSSSIAVFPHHSGAGESPLWPSREAIQCLMALKDEHRERTTRREKGSVLKSSSFYFWTVFALYWPFEKGQTNNETDRCWKKLIDEKKYLNYRLFKSLKNKSWSVYQPTLGDSLILSFTFVCFLHC